jgi:transposase-like protein
LFVNVGAGIAPVGNSPVKRRGRPSKFSEEVADRLVELIASGATVTAAAREVGVDRRTINHWRMRGRSAEPRDAPFAELERQLTAAGGKRTQRARIPNVTGR